MATCLRETRPTAVNLFWAIARMMKTAYETVGKVEPIQANLLKTAQAIQAEDLAIGRRIGDQGLPEGNAIKIEQRHPSEMSQIGDTVIAPAGIECYNYPFDIIPASLITGIITQQGTFSPNELARLQEVSHLPPA